MLVLSKQFLNRPVMSLRTGGQVGLAVQPIINPNNLKIEGFFCDDRVSRSRLVLLTQDIRDSVPQGLVINDREVLAPPDELVRLKKVLELDFQLIGKPVFTTDKKRVGKVIDWAADSAALYIQKLYVGRSVIKSLGQGQLSVDRTQIVEITDRKIVIQDILNTEKSVAPATAPAA